MLKYPETALVKFHSVRVMEAMLPMLRLKSLGAILVVAAAFDKMLMF